MTMRENHAMIGLDQGCRKQGQMWSALEHNINMWYAYSLAFYGQNVHGQLSINLLFVHLRL